MTESTNSGNESSDESAQKAGCSKCGTVAYRVPEENGTYCFSVADVTTVCSTDSGVFVHTEEL